MSRFHSSMLALARCGVVGLVLSISFSKSLFYVSAALMLTGWLLSGDWPRKWQLMHRSPVAVAATALFLVIASSALYSVADAQRVHMTVEAYAKLLFIPVIVSLIDTPTWRQRCWKGFVAGTVITLAHAYADIWFEIPWTRTYHNTRGGDTGVFQHHIAQTLVMAFLSAYSLYRAWRGQGLGPRWAWTVLSVLAAASITHLSIARTGQVTLLVAMLTLLMVSVPRRWVLPAGGAFTLAALLLVFSSGTIQDRFRLAYSEVAEFQFRNDYSSVGARLQMWNVSLKLIQEKPLLGHGAGAYSPLAEKAFADRKMCKIGCAQPHNQYLLLGVETGLVGMLAFVGLMVSALVVWRRLPDHNPLIPVYVAILGLTCLSDSGLFIRAQAYFFIPVLGLLASGPMRQGDAGTEARGARGQSNG